jgi:hypothetical protein
MKRTDSAAVDAGRGGHERTEEAALSKRAHHTRIIHGQTRKHAKCIRPILYALP